MTQTEANKQLVRRYVEEMWNQGRLAAAADFLAPDYRRHMGDRALDAQGQMQRIAGMRAAFPDLRMEIRDLLAEGDRVAMHLRMTGTQQAAFLGVTPSGRSVAMTAVDVLRIADGRIVEHWGAADMLGLMQQMGSLPKPA